MNEINEKEFYKVIEILKKEKDKIIPPKEIFQKIVTNSEVDRFVLNRGGIRNENEGRTSIFGEILKETGYMLNNWKVMLPVGIIAVFLIIFGITQFSNNGSLDKNMASEEQDLDSLGADIDQDANEDDALGEIDSALNKESGSVITVSEAIDVASITSESNGVGYGSDLDTFFSEEASLGEVNSALSDF
jgi:hypothetical protein